MENCYGLMVMAVLVTILTLVWQHLGIIGPLGFLPLLTERSTHLTVNTRPTHLSTGVHKHDVLMLTLERKSGLYQEQEAILVAQALLSQTASLHTLTFMTVS